MAGSPLPLTCPGCGAALVPMLPFGEKEWQYSHPWPSGCTEAGKPAAVRKEAVRMVANYYYFTFSTLTGTATAVSCRECGSGLVPEMVSREVCWVYEHKAGGCRWTGKRFKVVGIAAFVEAVLLQVNPPQPSVPEEIADLMISPHGSYICESQLKDCRADCDRQNARTLEAYRRGKTANQ